MIIGKKMEEVFMRRQGFTLIELVMVIVILGILAVVAVPRFIDLRASAKKAAADGVIAAGNAGAQIWHAQYLIDSTGTYSTSYPGTSTCCFESNTIPSVTGVTFAYSTSAGTWTFSS